MILRGLVQICYGAESVFLERLFPTIGFAPYPGLWITFKTPDGEDEEFKVKDVYYDVNQGEFTVSPETEFVRAIDERDDHIGAWIHAGFRRT